MPDSPTYVGPLTFELKDGVITQFKGDGEHESVPLPRCQVSVVRAEPFVDGDFRSAALLTALPESYREHCGPTGVSALYAQLLAFSDGSEGALVVGGECCYYVLVAKDMVYEIAEGALNDVAVLPEAFPNNMQADVLRPTE